MPESLLTIVFRGLMVFHKQGSGPGSVFEVGLHSATRHKEHFLRINTIKNGIVADIRPLEDAIGTTNRRWNVEIDGQIGNSVKLSPHTTTAFNRKDDENNDEEDFAWTMDLESDSFFGPLGTRIDTANLRPVIRVPSGRCYSRIKSPKVRRKTDGSTTEPDFGRLCGAVGCDIRLTGQHAQLLPEGSDEPLFIFKVAPNTIYEVAYLPPDFPPPAEPTDHFHHFYHKLLDTTLPEFSFEVLSGAVAPSPALCGEIFLGVREDEL